VKKILSILVCIVFAAVPVWAAFPDEVVPGGHTIGVKINTQGLLLVCAAPVKTADGESNPAQAAGLVPGDMITLINDEAMTETTQLTEFAETLDGKALQITYVRDGVTMKTLLTPAKSEPDGRYRLGLWVRDNMAGIGTVTYYDPESGLFGSLGHGVNGGESGNPLPLESGQVIYSEVESVRPGESGKPGELRGKFRNNGSYGSLKRNTKCGLFGILHDESVLGDSLHRVVPVANENDISEGKAYILSNIEGGKVEKYDIEILKIYGLDHQTRNFMIRVTDPDLLKKTAGIVQGMSGSPILQNGKIVGAVTHVLVNDPERGYGIFIENMIKEGLDVIMGQEKLAA